MNTNLERPLILRKYYFPLCIGSYYLLGYLYIFNISIIREAAKFSNYHFAPIIEVIPRYRQMFTYLRASDQTEEVGLVSLVLTWMAILVAVTCSHMAIFRKATYESGGEKFLDKQGKFGIATIVLATPILFIPYLLFIAGFLSDFKLRLSWLHDGDIGKSSFVLASEASIQHGFLLLFFFLIYVIHFIYKPLYKAQGKQLLDC